MCGNVHVGSWGIRRSGVLYRSRVRRTRGGSLHGVLQVPSHRSLPRHYRSASLSRSLYIVQAGASVTAKQISSLSVGRLTPFSAEHPMVQCNADHADSVCYTVQRQQSPPLHRGMSTDAIAVVSLSIEIVSSHGSQGEWQSWTKTAVLCHSFSPSTSFKTNV